MALLRGIQLFDRNGEKVLETLCPFAQFQFHEVELRDDERILGFKARKQSETAAYYLDFQLVIGRIV